MLFRSISPEGHAIRDVTRLAFTASGSDPDGDVLSYEWDFGDGSRAHSQTAEHVFEQEADFLVALTVGDGLTTTTVTEIIHVGLVTGSWRSSSPGFVGETAYLIVQWRGRQFGYEVHPVGLGIVDYFCLLMPSRGIFLEYGVEQEIGCIVTFTGELDAELLTMTGTLVCAAGGPSCGCAGQQRPFTLARQ